MVRFSSAYLWENPFRTVWLKTLECMKLHTRERHLFYKSQWRHRVSKSCPEIGINPSVFIIQGLFWVFVSIPSVASTSALPVPWKSFIYDTPVESEEDLLARAKAGNPFRAAGTARHVTSRHGPNGLNGKQLRVTHYVPRRALSCRPLVMGFLLKAAADVGLCGTGDRMYQNKVRRYRVCD